MWRQEFGSMFLVGLFQLYIVCDSKLRFPVRASQLRNSGHVLGNVTCGGIQDAGGPLLSWLPRCESAMASCPQVHQRQGWTRISRNTYTHTVLIEFSIQTNAERKEHFKKRKTESDKELYCLLPLSYKEFQLNFS